MSSARDRLRQANKANEAMRGNTSTDDTIFGDFISRKDTAENTDISDTDTETKLYTNTKAATFTESSDTSIKAEMINSAQGKPIENINTANSAIIPTATANEPALTNTLAASEPNIKAKDTVRTKSITVGMSEDAYKFLYKKAIQEGSSCTRYLQKLLKEEIEQEQFEDNDLADKCRKRQHDVLTKCFTYDETFVGMIKQKAQDCLMRPTHFVVYCIEKHRIAESQK